jgi:hypothetical protein
MPPSDHDLRQLRKLARQGRRAGELEAELAATQAELRVWRSLAGDHQNGIGQTVSQAAELARRAEEARAARVAAAEEAKAKELPVERVKVPDRDKRGGLLSDKGMSFRDPGGRA